MLLRRASQLAILLLFLTGPWFALSIAKGTLAPGKRADLVILSRDPTAVPPEQIREIRVLETVRNGGTVYVRE